MKAQLPMAPEPALHGHIQALQAALPGTGRDRLDRLPVPRRPRWRPEGCAEQGIQARPPHGGGGL